MRLEDKIRPHALLWDCYNDEPEKYNHINKLIKITDEFAIGFAEWMSKYKFLPNKGWYVTSYQIEMDIFKTSKELLEIYKKEKQL